MELRVGLVLLGAIVLLSALVPELSPYDSEALVGDPLESPSTSHLFGTDQLGRDVFVRTFQAGRVDLVIAFFGVVVPLLTGSLVGIAVGLLRPGWLETLLIRTFDAILAIPFVLLVLVLVLVAGADWALGPMPAGMAPLFLALFLVGWVIYARLARARTLVLRDADFVTAARALGYSRWTIVRRHILPNVLDTTATYAVLDSVLVIAVAASLPFLGAGVQPPTAEWGNLIYEGRTTLTDSPWVVLLPGAVLVTAAVALSLLADALIARRGEA